MTQHDPETLGSRLVRENTTLKRGQEKTYRQLRKIEEQIRKHAEGECGCKSEKHCLLALYRYTPRQPRPTWTRLFRS